MLEGGEEGVELRERGAMARLQSLDRGDAAGEGLLEGEGGKKDWNLRQPFSV